MLLVDLTKRKMMYQYNNSFEVRRENLIRLPFPRANEKLLKSLINKLEMFTNYKVKRNTV